MFFVLFFHTQENAATASRSQTQDFMHTGLMQRQQSLQHVRVI